MNLPEVADFAPWQQRAYARACEAMDAGRLAHGLLFCGPERMGKRAVAERLAQRLLCVSRDADGEPCGTCRSCRLFLSRAQAEPAEVRPDGRLAHPWGKPAHPDALLVGHAINASTDKPRTEIVIDQMRALSEKLSLTPQYGDAMVALIDPAEAINHAGCNALLKTLEEPRPGRYLWLLSAASARLPATIRSRCQRLEFRLPARAEALDWLRTRGHADAAAQEALDAARGHPGLAAAWLADGGLDLRREVARQLAQLARGDAAVVDVAQAWAADENTALRLRFAADLALDQAARLTDPLRTRRLAAWFDAANRTRDLLRTTVRTDLSLVELLLDWRDGQRAGRMGTG